MQVLLVFAGLALAGVLFVVMAILLSVLVPRKKERHQAGTSEQGSLETGGAVPSRRLRKHGDIARPVGLLALLAFVVFVLSIIATAREWYGRKHSPLPELAFAMHRYQDRHGRLPPAARYGENGEPLLSWRVLLLPFLGQAELYEEFRLDEPWDSPHNLALLPRMPEVYAPPPGKSRKVPPYHTVCHVFVGEETAFESRKGLRIPEDFSGGTGMTLLVVEAGKPVPWTKPEDIPYNPSGPLPDLRGLYNGGFRSVTADGSALWIDEVLAQSQFVRRYISRHGDRW